MRKLLPHYLPEIEHAIAPVISGIYNEAAEYERLRFADYKHGEHGPLLNWASGVGIDRCGVGRHAEFRCVTTLVVDDDVSVYDDLVPVQKNGACGGRTTFYDLLTFLHVAFPWSATPVESISYRGIGARSWISSLSRGNSASN
jgi:hypothetical protein